jgi:ADP-heptose:LPS heptosyltransferase
MSMGEAKRLHKQTRQHVLILRADGMPVRSDLFAGIPYLADRRTALLPYVRYVNGPGARPYIAQKGPQQWKWKAYKPVPAEIVFTRDELDFAEPFRGMVMVEPNTKSVGHTNKDWGPISWQQLDSALHAAKIETMQCGPAGTRWLMHTRGVVTDTFRKACAVLSVCRAYVGPEGGLHHAAAAVGVPAVVIFGGFIAPEVTGYPAHRNLFTGTELGCGMRTDCAHCRAAMVKITPAEVLAHLKEILK